MKGQLRRVIPGSVDNDNAVLDKADLIWLNGVIHHILILSDPTPVTLSAPSMTDILAFNIFGDADVLAISTKVIEVGTVDIECKGT